MGEVNISKILKYILFLFVISISFYLLSWKFYGQEKLISKIIGNIEHSVSVHQPDTVFMVLTKDDLVLDYNYCQQFDKKIIKTLTTNEAFDKRKDIEQMMFENKQIYALIIEISFVNDTPYLTRINLLQHTNSHYRDKRTKFYYWSFFKWNEIIFEPVM